MELSAELGGRLQWEPPNSAMHPTGARATRVPSRVIAITFDMKQEDRAMPRRFGEGYDANERQK